MEAHILGLVGGELALQGQAYITGYWHIVHLEVQGVFYEVQKVRFSNTLRVPVGIRMTPEMLCGEQVSSDGLVI